MSVSIQTVEFERREAFLSELDEGPPYTVHGVALGADDVTVGQSGIKKLWPADELKEAADSLEGRSLVVDHDNSSSGVVGQVTKAGYKENVGVIYEAELFDDELAEKIDAGLLEVSIRGKHVDVEEMEETDEGAKIVEDIQFDNLSVVPTGAAPSNTIEIGETDELSVAELSAFTETLERAELQEIEPGMWVQWDGGKGITISRVQDGEIEVDVYEESDGKWRSTGETTMMSTDDLSEWDVDEEEDIGAAEDGDEESDDEEEPEDEEEAQDIPNKFMFESEEDAMDFIEDKDGLTGVHEMDGMYMPGDTHEEFLEWWDNQSSQSGHEGEDEDEMSEHKGESKDTPTFEEGQMVQWQVRPDMFGKVVHVPDDQDIVMVDVMEQSDGEMESTGFTVTAGYSDIVPMEQEEMSSSEEELQELEIHSVDFDGTTEGEWSKPAMEDFDTDDMSEIDDHFLVSKTGFPPDNYTDLALPVVEPNGNLNLNALQNAKARAGQVEGLSGDDLDRVESKINSLAEDNFEGADFEEASDESPRNATPVTVLTGDDLQQSNDKTGESELDNTTQIKSNMTEEIEEKLAELNDPVAVEQDDLEELQDKADRFEEMSDTLESLKERTDVLDDVDRDQVEELAEADEPVVVESARMEALEAEAEQVKATYASALVEELGMFSEEELTDKFSIEELREKYEEQIGDPEELAEPEDADPRSGDPEEEELEEAAEEEEQDEEQLEEQEEIEEMQAELKEKILDRN